MVDFICKGLLELWEAQIENYKVKISCHSGIWTGTRYKARVLTIMIALLELTPIGHLKINRILPELFAIQIYL